MSEDDKKERLFKRLKNTENAQKNLIRDGDNESIYNAPRSEFNDKDNKYKKKHKITPIYTQNHQISLIILKV